MEPGTCVYRDNSRSREIGGGGVNIGGGCNEVETGFWPPMLPPRGLTFWPDPDVIVGMVTLFHLRGVGIPG